MILITSSLLYILLFLGVVWFILSILFLYEHFTNYLQLKKWQEEMIKNKQQHQESTSPPVLIGKSKVTTSQYFPALPLISSPEHQAEEKDNFAQQNAVTATEYHSPTFHEEEDNELDVDYTSDEMDEEEILREELGLTDDALLQVSSSAILSRDLLRMQQWSKGDDAIEKEHEEEFMATLGRIQHTDLLDKYEEYLKKQQGGHHKVLAYLRKAEQDHFVEEVLPPIPPHEQGEKPLSYYL